VTGPNLPDQPEMGDEMARLWDSYDELLRRCLALEEISDRLAVTSADPVAVADYLQWKAESTPPPT
jgi:hypothetical protein